MFLLYQKASITAKEERNFAKFKGIFLRTLLCVMGIVDIFAYLFYDVFYYFRVRFVLH